MKKVSKLLKSNRQNFLKSEICQMRPSLQVITLKEKANKSLVVKNVTLRAQIDKNQEN